MSMEIDEAVEFTEFPSNLRRRRSMKMNIGFSYIPKENPKKPLGEDACFIHQTKQTFGLADGVGGWSRKGIDGGKYARELMENAFNYVLNLRTGVSVDPTKVLEHAYSKTKAKGSSTACIVTLRGDFLHAANLGDSGFVVIRDGEIVFETIPQQHYFNCPFQLEKSSGSDDPGMADEIFIPVEPRDVIVAGTDGLFDNVYKEEIEDLVETCLENEFTAESAAEKITEVALSKSMCESSVSPFTEAAVEAGFDMSEYMGGKYDDITVVVAYVV